MGYVEGKNISYVYRWADGSQKRLQEFAAELVTQKVDVIFAAARHADGDRSTAGNANHTDRICRTLATRSAPSWLRASRTRGATSPVSSISPQDIAGKQLEYLKEAIPEQPGSASSGGLQIHRTGTS